MLLCLIYCILGICYTNSYCRFIIPVFISFNFKLFCIVPPSSTANVFSPWEGGALCKKKLFFESLDLGKQWLIHSSFATFVKRHGNSSYFQIPSTYDKLKNTFAKITNFTYACHALLTRSRNLMLSILHKDWIDKYSLELPLSIQLQNVPSLKIINFFQLFLCFPLGGESGLFYWIYLFSQWLHLDFFFT